MTTVWYDMKDYNIITKEIGGYLGLELNCQYDNIGSSIALNSARNCLRYVIRAFNIKEVYIPIYTCPVVVQAVEQENCKIKFYQIDELFMPANEFEEDAYILYTNYFGVCTKNVKTLAAKYKNLIVDNSQSFYTPHYGIASFNSLRKFFGVPDGALLYTDRKLNIQFDKGTSWQRCLHLLKRLDISAEFGYKDFCTNDNSLIGEDIKLISNFTKSIFNSIDIWKAKEKRILNFKYLSSALMTRNQLNIVLDKDDVPLCYPYMIKESDMLRKQLINNKIYIPTYWNELPKGTVEYSFRNNILPLPIDQRYTTADMDKVLEVINA